MPVPAEPCLQRVRECRGRASGPASSSTGHHGSKPARWRADGAAHEHEVDAFYVKSAGWRADGAAYEHEVDALYVSACRCFEWTFGCNAWTYRFAGWRAGGAAQEYEVGAFHASSCQSKRPRWCLSFCISLLRDHGPCAVSSYPFRNGVLVLLRRIFRGNVQNFKPRSCHQVIIGFGLSGSFSPLALIIRLLLGCYVLFALASKHSPCRNQWCAILLKARASKG
eukprot:83316-Pelagomonas_calceolata.AAC.13